jgi:hypothetical protein
MEAQMTPIIPIKQVLVSFAGQEFLAVQLPDGRIAVVLRHFCEALHLNFWGQIERIQANPTLARNFLLVQIKTPGGPQVVYALAVSVLSLWLGGFRLGRLSEEKRQLIIQLQEDAEAAFSRPFQVSETPEPPKHSAPPKPEPALPQSAPAPSSVPELLRKLAGTATALAGTAMELAGRVEQDGVSLEQRLGLMERQQMADAAWKAEMHHQMQLQHEQTEVLWSVVLGSASAPDEALSADQQHTLQLLLRYHQQATGRPIQATEREVLRLVGAAEPRNLRQGDWKQILAWFRQQLGR